MEVVYITNYVYTDFVVFAPQYFLTYVRFRPWYSTELNISCRTVTASASHMGQSQFALLLNCWQKSLNTSSVTK